MPSDGCQRSLCKSDRLRDLLGLRQGHRTHQVVLNIQDEPLARRVHWFRV